MRLIKRLIRISAWTIAWGVGLVLCAFGFGIDAHDTRVLRDFCDGVQRWQSGPDFRQVAYEYVRLSHAAMNSTPFGVRATTLIMSIRSIPGLGPKYAVSPTSQAHYDDFTRGELSAYLHLCGEQTMEWVIRDLQGIAQRGAEDSDIKRFLDSWRMNRPVANDLGAIAGVKRLLSDVDGVSFEPREQVESELKTEAARLASRLGYSNARQREHEIFDRLDEDLHERNPQLWRQKQVSDLCSGIWAQTFGGDYVMVIAPALQLREIGRIAGPLLIVVFIALAWRNRRAGERKAAEHTPDT